jgi:hypothetical protein
MERITLKEGAPQRQSCQYSHFRVDPTSLSMLNLADRTHSLESEESTGRQRLNDIIGK